MTRETASIGVHRVEGKEHPPVFAFWCGACGEVHSHGGSSLGMRAAHCRHPASPFAGGSYVLDAIGDAPTLSALVPTAVPFAGRRSLADVFEKSSPALAREIFKRILWTRAAPVDEKKFGEFSLDSFNFAASWSISSKGREPRKGEDLLDFIADAYGASPGDVALMALESATRTRFDSATALAIVQIVNQWRVSGRPSRAQCVPRDIV